MCYRKEREEMFKKILYPTDFSEVSKKAINYIKQLKDAGTEEVVVLHVLNEKGVEAIALYASGSFDELLQRVEKEAADEMKKIEADLKESGFKVKLRIEIGTPLTDILKVEQEEGVSAIVIGSHGKTNVKEMLLGSVSEKVIRKSKNPVLVIRR
jgi:nucleotide-binding universal stress UspA family protein